VKRLENVRYGRHIIDERNIHRLDFRPKWKAAISNNQRVGVADATDQRVDLRVQYSSLYHDKALKRI
jgi:hypothetical protein